ncbi:hypothetical protein LNQ49_00950 [Flavobacterium sp. F-65]|jgi:hypothetical protein|uniref:Uncharacterized protein n=1 Tax=Flavobacterium pisciphilum TaxID=2893755 RepID=A0ABS8MN25_9FLAO|nr:hypothetical protein [Flavobacterium sp. F-65]MCC9070173.1 hypothetical protein [Flavobacterium sp. F-65]
MTDKILRISYIEGIPVLLFGDGNKAIIKLENIDFYNVLGKMSNNVNQNFTWVRRDIYETQQKKK